MSPRRQLEELRRRLDATDDADDAVVAPCTPTDGGVLDRELAAAFAGTVSAFRGEGRAERALGGPPDQLTWHDLDALARSDPDKARARWREVIEAARDELRGGRRAARVAGASGWSCWPRARFLALRAELADAWGPRNQLEQLLVDQLTQFQTLMERWQETLGAYAELSAQDRRLAEGQGTPRLSDAEPMEHAAGMAERYHRLFLRSLRALQDQRRLGRPVVVRRAGQVNIAQQQVNVSGLGRGGGRGELCE
jgi:hypothetical protein